MNAARHAEGLPGLAWYGAAAAVARDHCRDMLERDQIFHESPRTGSPSDRVHRAGIRAAVIMENVARAPTVPRAHEGLMKSPGHRANILSREATHVGIGIIRDDKAGQLYVTQVFLRLLAPFDPASARRDLRRLITARRKAAGASVPAVAPPLDEAAQRLAEVASSHDGSVGDEVYQRTLEGLSKTWGRIQATQSVVPDPAQAASLEGLTSPAAGIGIGVARGRHSELGDNAAFVVVLVAEPR